MRAKVNLPSSADRRLTNKLAMPGMPLSSVPLEWLDPGCWRLPSGKALVEFALQSGFLAPLLFNAGQFGTQSTLEVRPVMGGRKVAARSKQSEKGSSE